MKTVDLEFIQEDLPKILTSMKFGTERIREIVLSLRNFSRLDEAEVKPAHIHEGIDSTLLILGHQIRACSDQQPVEIVKNYSDLPPIECSPAQLNQVFMNILLNALDALEVTTQAQVNSNNSQFRDYIPRIWIDTQIYGPDQVEIRIRDNGIGIDEANKTKVFDYFFTTKPIGKGTGLGLAISRQIIFEKHGGELSFNSISGQGTEFVIRLPIQLKK
ncbi:MAG: HAMP domain-containing histidine kinase [Oscillatoriales cyanobacterium SM2_3_0]|nr:HAMP domain-containing histidine kinase [Oscillatoriales cyanobacterium SM2_3_0]